MGKDEPTSDSGRGVGQDLPTLDSDERVSVRLDFSPELSDLSRGVTDDEETQDTLSEMSFQFEYSSIDDLTSRDNGTSEAAAGPATSASTIGTESPDAEDDAALEQYVAQNADRSREQVTGLWALIHWLAQIVQSQLPAPSGARSNLQLEPTIRGDKYRMLTSFGYLWNTIRVSIDLRYTGTELSGISVTFGFSADHGLGSHPLPPSTADYRSVKSPDAHVYYLLFEGATLLTEFDTETLAASTMDDLHRFMHGAVRLANQLGLH